MLNDGGPEGAGDAPGSGPEYYDPGKALQVKFWQLLRSSSLPSILEAEKSGFGNAHFLNPFSELDLLHVAAFEIRRPAADVVRIASLVASVGFTWYPQHRITLHKLVQLLAAHSDLKATCIVRGLRHLAACQLCVVCTAADVAKILAAATEPQEAACRAALFLDTLHRAKPWLKFMRVVPILLQGWEGGKNGSEAELAKGIAQLCADGALEPPDPSKPDCLDIERVWRALTQLDMHGQDLVLRMIRITALHVVALSKAASFATPQPCSANEFENIITLVRELKMSDVVLLTELGDAGILRSDWAVILSLLASLQGTRREVALRSAIWLNAESPAWLQWPDVLAHVESLDDATARLEVMDVLAEILQCGKEVEWRSGKDEDFSAGVSTRFQRWVHWLLKVAHCPKWLALVRKLYGSILPLDPSGKSCLTWRLSCSHAFPCSWVAPDGLGCSCYCEYLVDTVVPLLLSICPDATPELFDTVANYVRWRRGPELVIATSWLKQAIVSRAASRTDANTPVPASILSELLSCHLLFESKTRLQALVDVPLEIAAASAHAVSKSCRNIPTQAALGIFQHIIQGYSVGHLCCQSPGGDRKAACEFAAAAAQVLAFMPRDLRQAQWITGLLRSCCIRWQLQGVGTHRLTQLLRKACHQSLVIARVCKEPPPFIALLNGCCECGGLEHNLALLLVAY